MYGYTELPISPIKFKNTYKHLPLLDLKVTQSFGNHLEKSYNIFNQYDCPMSFNTLL